MKYSGLQSWIISVLHAVVNNAGIGGSRLLEFIPLTQVRQLFEVNSLGILRVCQRFAPLVRRGQGRIVNVTSIAGLTNNELQSFITKVFN